MGFERLDLFLAFFQVIFPLAYQCLVFFLLFPVELLCGRFLCGAGGSFRYRCQELLFFEIIVVVSDIIDKLLVREFEYAACRPVDEIAVVRDIENSAFIGIQRCLEDLF